MADVQDAGVAVPGGAAGSHPLQIEMNGINVITDSQRKGRPRDLFWPWFAANVSVLGLSYGSFGLGFGFSSWRGFWGGGAGGAFPFLLVGVGAAAREGGGGRKKWRARAPRGGAATHRPPRASWPP